MENKLKEENLTELTLEIEAKLNNCETYNEKEDIYKEVLFMGLNQGILTEEFNDLINIIYELNNIRKNTDDPVLLFDGFTQDWALIYVFLRDLTEMIRIHKLSRNEVIELLQSKTDDIRLDLDKSLSANQIKELMRMYILTCEDLLECL